MYKIYINDTPLTLVEARSARELPVGDEQNLVARYPGASKFLLHYIDMLEKTDRFDSITLFYDDYPQLVADFEGLYQLIEAAGGLVFSPDGQALVIFRRAFWDLPKGKIDPGETPAEAAIREVQEETGLGQLILQEKLSETYHTYRDAKGNRILKRTYWFRMLTEEKDLIPQEEEDIEAAVWVNIAELLSRPDLPLYRNIREVLELGL